LNIFELRAKCRRLKNKHNIGLIIIDYLQLMSGSADRNSNREQEISKISRDLKGLAKELQVPIIALSQLSREVRKAKGRNKMPQLSDLRESGAIEQDADMVMFLYRPEYYDITANEFGESNKGETHVKIAKHRNGSLETIKLKALLHIQKFIEDEADESNKKQLATQLIKQSSNQLVLIGPEGDFTATEIKAAIENNFIPVALGDTRLRTETAGIVAATLLQNG
jgi:replicative DNA helicase